MYIEFAEDVYPQAKLSIFDWEKTDVKVIKETKQEYNDYVFYESHFLDNYKK